MTETTLHDIATACARGERPAQKALYQHFKSKMLGVCLRYADNHQDAEDMLQEGFVKIFRDIHQFQGAGSLEGWIRRVVVNVALQHIKKHRKRMEETENYIQETGESFEEISVFETETTPKAVLKLMQQLPLGFRTVLNLYVLENYSHQQIAEELGISVGTSKSQLNRAKACLKALLEKNLA